LVERTIAHTARELAGKFYDFVRSAEKRGEKVDVRFNGRTLQNIDPTAFGKSFPTVKDYLAGRRYGEVEHRADGTVFWKDTGKWRQYVPGWMSFYEMARQLNVQMLAEPHVTDTMKERIFDAIIEDREKQLKQEAKGIKPANIPQRNKSYG
jgi:hypothetical protein